MKIQRIKIIKNQLQYRTLIIFKSTKIKLVALKNITMIKMS